MQNSKYLPVGSVIGGHYEIVEVLGEDDFEILYLVKDKHRGDALCILKELFLKALSLRDKKLVYAFAKSKYVFEQTKKEVIAEAVLLQKNNKNNNIQIYGYFEDNNTVYTIMEFLNDAKSDEYLKVQDKKEEKPKEIELPPLESVESLEKKTKPKSFFFLKVLIASLLTFIILGWYAYKMLKEDKKRVEEKVPTVVVNPKPPKPTYHPTLTNRATEEEQPQKTETKEPVVEIEEPFTPIVEHEAPVNKTDRFNKTSINSFLKKFIASSSSGSVQEIVSHYDDYVDRYFSLKNVTHAQIQKDKIRYHRRWTQRDFEIIDFEIVNIYRKNDIDYCDIKTTTRWNVSTDSGKTASGISRGLMTLKSRVDGFKVTSIYTLK